MFGTPITFRVIASRLSSVMDLAIHRLSTYVVPIAIGLFSIVAIVAWQIESPDAIGKPIHFQVMEDRTAAMSPRQALEQLARQPHISRWSTHLSEAPFWVAIDGQPSSLDRTKLEFPSRHAMDISCWDAGSFRTLGQGTRAGTDGLMESVKAGFALSLDSGLPPVGVLCRMTFVGPARITVEQWTPELLQLSTQQFSHKSGLLDGGMILLSIFILITALINREASYVMFAAWLILNLRVGAMSAGWDANWLGHSVPQEWLLRMRLVTIAAYYMLTVTLFRTVFRHQLAKIGNTIALRLVQWACLPLLILSTTLAYKDFLPFMWGTAAFVTVLFLFLIGRILLWARSSFAVLYSASICMTLFSWCSEVVAAALGMDRMIGSVNLVTAALSSSLLAALAIAEKMRVEHNEKLEAQTELVHTYEAMPIGLFTLDTAGNFLSTNPAFDRMLGRDTMLTGHNKWEQFFKDGAWEQVQDLVKYSSRDLEIESRHIDDEAGAPKRFLVKAALARDKIEGSLQDITEKFKATEHLRFLANNDSLTKVLNRRGIEAILKTCMSELGEGQTLALAYLDLDRFKLINDLYGHSAGDEVLKQVCAKVTSMIDKSHFFGRVGGDEFIIILPNITIGVARWFCRGIAAGISSESFHVGDKAFQIRGSIGLVEVGAGTQIKDAVSTADRACREAKIGHPDGVVTYERNSSAIRDLEEELVLVERLSSDTVGKDLLLMMQPIMSLTAPLGSLNFEVLLRMRDRDGSIIGAERLIAAGESSGCMGIIDRWVMSTTLAWLVDHHSELNSTQFVCMNLSGASLNDERFVEAAYSMLAQNIYIASRLCIEITEGVALRDLVNTRRFIDKVRSFGAKVALDDFGAGYTSFTYLRDLPADLLKIDGSFIVDMNKHPANVAVVEAIVNLARNLGMKTIAEWAEDAATVQVLAEIGVDYVQGFVVARPQNPANIIQASSSAAFIQDENLYQFIRSLDQSVTNMVQLDLLDKTGIRRQRKK